MTAADRLRALDERLGAQMPVDVHLAEQVIEKVEFRNEAAPAAVALRNALPAIIAVVEAAETISPEHLRALATWHDIFDSDKPGRGTEVQRDLRLLADRSEAALRALWDALGGGEE